jgi:uncharacterized membrane protein YhaH (DUF805 family)
MQSLISRGTVLPQTLVWTEGMADWAETRASELRAFLGAVPPPLATASPPHAALSSPPLGAWDAARPAAVGLGGGPAPGMGFVEAIRYCFVDYATFSGRASRSQYWFFTFFLALGNVAAALVDMAFQGASGDQIGVISAIFSLATLIPSFAVASRRFHDAGWRFWWFLVVIVPLLGWIFVIYVTVTRDPGPNRFDAPR